MKYILHFTYMKCRNIHCPRKGCRAELQSHFGERWEYTLQLHPNVKIKLMMQLQFGVISQKSNI